MFPHVYSKPISLSPTRRNRTILIWCRASLRPTNANPGAFHLHGCSDGSEMHTRAREKANHEEKRSRPYWYRGCWHMLSSSTIYLSLLVAGLAMALTSRVITAMSSGFLFSDKI
ncbi:hypothetical protein HRR83_003943 [Exophiala dermatitidis]|uniref:Uncharacterized protein n=1 Tax=Exophiala dermatitidis TaxID=5970 RepID=A0AAN6IWK3_EXODE|nr:hypothetical protein HRR74_002672 [Exophiala dermatitidis]KAJ4529418.1 hypothetical protein HRR73_000441 [Exophiala dermatitidis]KAJ4543926.1 hypothetical protein HRR76_001985 [Exophiala dermatitidis]KAJ4575392.1 hypothetical protein HRR79_002314 [Exophiala dermatitidis]KAJ4582794.1 hypothetical protein HRR81_001524 [Exophiala dermatitidis]